MQQVKNGDVVKVHYTGKLTNGEQFDSSEGREPLEFTVGGGQMIKGFDDAMPGMSIGQKKTPFQPRPSSSLSLSRCLPRIRYSGCKFPQNYRTHAIPVWFWWN